MKEVQEMHTLLINTIMLDWYSVGQGSKVIAKYLKEILLFVSFVIILKKKEKLGRQICW